MLKSAVSLFLDITPIDASRDYNGCDESGEYVELAFGKFYDDASQESNYDNLFIVCAQFDENNFGKFYSNVYKGGKYNEVRIYTMKGLSEHDELYMAIYEHDRKLFDCIQSQGLTNADMDKKISEIQLIETTRVDALHAYSEHVTRALTTTDKRRINSVVRMFFYKLNDTCGSNEFRVGGYSNVDEPNDMFFKDHIGGFEELRSIERIQWTYSKSRSGGYVFGDFKYGRFLVEYIAKENNFRGGMFKDFTMVVERDENRDICYVGSFDSFKRLYLKTLNVFEWTYLYLLEVNGRL
jgi:hypothetical protein